MFQGNVLGFNLGPGLFPVLTLFTYLNLLRTSDQFAQHSHGHRVQTSNVVPI